MKKVGDYQTDLSGVLSIYHDTIEEFKNFYQLKCLILERDGEGIKVKDEIKKLYKGKYKEFTAWKSTDDNTIMLTDDVIIKNSFSLIIDSKTCMIYDTGEVSLMIPSEMKKKKITIKYFEDLINGLKLLPRNKDVCQDCKELYKFNISGKCDAALKTKNLF